MIVDSGTAKIAAEELDHDEPKMNSLDREEIEATEARKSSSDTDASIEHTEEKISESRRDVEGQEAEDVTPPPVKVVRSKRRGLFGRFTLLAEITEPKHYSRGTKWWITFIVAMAAVAAPMGSAIILRKHSHIQTSHQ